MTKRNLYVCIVIATLYAMANIDRYVMNLMIEPIKRDFGASDVQISLLVGLTFSFFYLSCGLLVARLADRWNRRNLLAMGAAMWSLMTVACGSVQTFAGLFLARMGIGVGEGTITPCGQSMIADEVPPDALAKGMGIFTIGSLMGVLLAYILGGVLLAWSVGTFPDGLELPIVGHIFNWQLTFLMLGFPGLLLAILFFTTVREPARRGAEAGAKTFAQAWAYTQRHSGAYYWMIAGGVLAQAGAGGGAATWFPALIERKYGLGPDVAGPLMAGALVLPGIVSALAGGWIADRARRNGNLRSYASIATWGVGISILPMGMAALMPSASGLAFMAGVGTLFGFASQPMTASAVQAISPSSMRATIAALFGAAAAIVSYGLTPFVVASLTDYVFADESALDYSLAIVITTTFLAATYCFWKARAPLEESLRTLSPSTTENT